MTILHLTPELCRAAALDAGNRNMRKHGRTAWNAEDYRIACETLIGLMETLYHADLA